MEKFHRLGMAEEEQFDSQDSAGVRFAETRYSKFRVITGLIMGVLFILQTILIIFHGLSSGYYLILLLPYAIITAILYRLKYKGGNADQP